ncbi:hypothetical protein IGL98_000405 [Enterococcus sp. DIV0840]|nr:hypothetical protein [Enterococcus sp. DIV0849a]MBO0435751.1 hypothetical protein [Enterococcus sp. DIV0849a]
MDLDVLIIGDQYIDYTDIRYIKIHDFRKWSADPGILDESPFGTHNDYFNTESDQELMDAAYTEYFDDNGWIE